MNRKRTCTRLAGGGQITGNVNCSAIRDVLPFVTSRQRRSGFERMYRIYYTYFIFISVGSKGRSWNALWLLLLTQFYIRCVAVSRWSICKKSSASYCELINRLTERYRKPKSVIFNLLFFRSVASRAICIFNTVRPKLRAYISSLMHRAARSRTAELQIEDRYRYPFFLRGLRGLALVCIYVCARRSAHIYVHLCAKTKPRGVLDVVRGRRNFECGPRRR